MSKSPNDRDLAEEITQLAERVNKLEVGKINDKSPVSKDESPVSKDESSVSKDKSAGSGGSKKKKLLNYTARSFPI